MACAAYGSTSGIHKKTGIFQPVFYGQTQSRLLLNHAYGAFCTFQTIHPRACQQQALKQIARLVAASLQACFQAHPYSEN